MLTPSRPLPNDPGGRNVAFRKLGAVLVAGTLFAALAACGDDDSAETSETTEAAAGSANFTPVTEDTLTVVTSLPAPGFWEGDDPSDITGGYEYEIAKALQERLGMGDLEIVNVSFDQLVAGQVGDFDVALSQVTITDERKQVVDFTEPYFESDQGVLVLAGTKVDTVDEARALQWGVQSGTTGADYITDVVAAGAGAPGVPGSGGRVRRPRGRAGRCVHDGHRHRAGTGQPSRAAPRRSQPSSRRAKSTAASCPRARPTPTPSTAILTELKDDGSLSEFAEQWLGGDPSAVPVLTP